MKHLLEHYYQQLDGTREEFTTPPSAELTYCEASSSPSCMVFQKKVYKGRKHLCEMETVFE